MIEVFLISLLFAAPAIGLAAANRRVLPKWPNLRLSLLSAVPLPAVVLAGSVWLHVDVINTPREKCGVDACGMALTAASIFGMIAIGGFIAGVAGCSVYLSRSRSR